MKIKPCRFIVSTLVPAVLLFASPFSVIGEEIETNDWSTLAERYIGRLPKGWTINSKYNSGEASVVKTDNGTVLKITANADASKGFHIYNRDMMKVTPESRISVKVSASGRGLLGVVAYVYDEDEQTLGMIPKLEAEMQSPENGVFSELVYDLSMANQVFRKGRPAQIRLVIVASAGSEIEVQSLTAKME